jgi:protocatechuate 3,4-dioxygenase beta subunit
MLWMLMLATALTLTAGATRADALAQSAAPQSAPPAQKPASPSKSAKPSTPATTGTISGNVYDHHGAPLAGATVTAKGESGAATSVKTDAEGGYSFSKLAPGSYEVTFEAKGFNAKPKSVKVHVGKTAKVQVKMQIPKEC